jgi:phospholipase C
MAHVARNGNIKDLVVLLTEVRSLDHRVGFLKRVNPSICGLAGND